MAIKISGTTVIDDSRNFTNIQEINGLDYPASDGSAGQVLTTDGAGSLSLQDLPPAGPTVEAVASGTLPDGSPVIVNSDGTVSVVSETGLPQTVGSTTVFQSNEVNDLTSTFDKTNNKVIISYRNDNSYGTTVVGTVSGTSISFGSPVVYKSARIIEPVVTFDESANRVLIVYGDDPAPKELQAIVGEVIDDSITFGSPEQVGSVETESHAIGFDNNSNKSVVSFYDKDNGVPEAFLITVDDLTITSTHLSPTQINPYSSGGIVFTFDTNTNKFILTYDYYDGFDTNLASVVGTVDGDSISFGTPVTWSANHGVNPYLSMTFDSINNKVVIVYTDDPDEYGNAIVGTVDGDSINFGTPVVFESSRTYSKSVTFDPVAGKVTMAYRTGGSAPDVFYMIVGTVSGNSISFEPRVQIDNDFNQDFATTFDSNSNKVVVAYQDYYNAQSGTSFVFQNESTNLTAENFIGFSNAAYSDSQTATVQVIGSTDDAQSGLTPGQSYFVQGDGTLAETAGNPEVFAGTALSNTDILVKL